jgi:hypothetical protein
MSEDIQKSRSPNSPKFELGFALELTKKLYDKIGRSSVRAEVAVGALDYKSLSGASLTAIGALSQYGLIDRNGGNVEISQLALKILHPTDDRQKLAAIQESALRPKIFSEIREKWHDMSVDVLANHLIHQRFTVEAAKRSASVYKANSTLARLDATGQKPGDTTSIKSNTETSESIGLGALIANPASINMLANFKIPLGSAIAELTFFGEHLEPKDFDDLKEYVDLFKKQYERKIKVEKLPAAPAASHVPQDD